MNETAVNPTSILVGKVFLIATVRCPNGHRILRVHDDGRVIGAPAPGVLLIEHTDQNYGFTPKVQRLITLDDFMSREPLLYEDYDDANSSYLARPLLYDRCTGTECSYPAAKQSHS
jgi:hypothetical protein